MNVTPVRRVTAALLAGVALVSTLGGCTKTAAPATPSPSAPTRVVASASADPGPGDFEEGDN